MNGTSIYVRPTSSMSVMSRPSYVYGCRSFGSVESDSPNPTHHPSNILNNHQTSKLQPTNNSNTREEIFNTPITADDTADTTSSSTVGVGHFVNSRFQFLEADAFSAEGESRLTRQELNVRQPGDEEEIDAFQMNDEGEIEWMSNSQRPRIVVLGTGWGSVSFLKHLDVNKYEIVVVSPRNYFLFTPLLPSACVGTLSMTSLTEPIRNILLSRHKTRQNQYAEAKAVGLDREKQKVMCVDANGRSFMIQYDHLIIGVGANNNTFNTEGVKEYAYFLKEAKHALLIRKNILEHFERASSPTTSIAEKERLLQFVIVGGGPTGVEYAAELVDFLDSDLKRQFPTLLPLVRVRLLQSSDHILNTYDAAISRYAEEKFKQLRIEVITGAHVKAISEGSITYENKSEKKLTTIPFGICLWSTGIAMNAFTKQVSESISGQENGKALVTDGCLRLLKEIPRLDRVEPKIVAQAARAIQSSNKDKDHVAPKSTTATSAAAVPPTTTHEHDAQEEEKEKASPRLLKVDERVYALGDCATTYVPKLAKRLKLIFEIADVNGDGKLSHDELRNLCYTISQHFPVMSAQMSMIMNQYTHYASNEGELTLAKFEEMLISADRNVRVYPATAQVASQQGKYLAQRFNAFANQQIQAGKMIDYGGKDHEQLEQKLVKIGVQQRPYHPPVGVPDGFAHPSNPTCKPFRYKHLGSLAYIGDNSSVIDLGSGGTYSGPAAFWLWKSVYFSESVSWRTRISLASDWFMTWLFGRNTAH